jgi:hypothetical protein
MGIQRDLDGPATLSLDIVDAAAHRDHLRIDADQPEVLLRRAPMALSSGLFSLGAMLLGTKGAHVFPEVT